MGMFAHALPMDKQVVVKHIQWLDRQVEYVYAFEFNYLNLLKACFLKYNLKKRDKFVHYGLIPRSINYLFNKLRERTLQSNSVFYIRVSYYELYNEQVSH